MRAAALDRFGGPEVLTIHHLPVPAVEHNDVLIRLHTAGVGPWDADMRSGWWPGGNPPPFPIVLGSDGCGVIEAIGPGEHHLKVGQEVYAYSFANPKGGFYAEYAVVHSYQAAEIPRTLDLTHAGAVPTIGLTALQGIDDALHLKPEETVLIHGASGGVGHLAVQFARFRRSQVIATASGEDGVAFVRHLGVEHVIDGKKEDINAAVRRIVPEGVDAVLALAGGDPIKSVLAAMRTGARLAYPHGVEPMPTRWLGIEIIIYDAKAGVRQFTHLNRAIDDGKIRVVIAKSFPLGETARAHERLADGHILGKLALRVDT